MGARLGLAHAGPLTFLALRYALAAGLLLLVALVMPAPWPNRRCDAVTDEMVTSCSSSLNTEDMWISPQPM